MYFMYRLCLLMCVIGLTSQRAYGNVVAVYPPAGHYQVDPQHCSLIFKVKHLGYSYFVGRFNTVMGEMTFDPNHIENTTLSLTVDPASIDVNNSSLESDLKGDRWLNVIRFKRAFFTLTNLNIIDQNHATIQGTLEWRGIKKVETFSVTLIGFGDNIFSQSSTLGFSITGQIDRSDFGMTNLASFVDDSVMLAMDVELTKVE